MSEPSQSFIVSIPAHMDLRQRRLIGEDILAFIRSRTSKGLDIYGRPFIPYSKVYKDSLDFRNAGKTEKVNLTLTGEMVNLLMVLSTGAGWIKIGFDDRQENDKASYNRQHGRNFMGITEKDVNNIVKRYDGINSRDAVISEVSRAAGEEIARALFGGNDGDS